MFEIRFKTLSVRRERLQALDFVEAETPILQPQARGAIARPFFTHANALDADFSLRALLPSSISSGWWSEDSSGYSKSPGTSATKEATPAQPGVHRVGGLPGVR